MRRDLALTGGGDDRLSDLLPAAGRYLGSIGFPRISSVSFIKGRGFVIIWGS